MLDATTDHAQNSYLDSQLIAQTFQGDATQANMVVLGASLQAGLLPVSIEAMRAAVRMNGAMVEANLTALDWGRAWVQSPDAVKAALDGRPTPISLSPKSKELVDKVTREPGELRRVLEVRVPDLMSWGGNRVANDYVSALIRVSALEAARIHLDIVEDSLRRLTPDTRATVLEVVELPDMVRGFESIKLRNVERFRQRADELRKQLLAEDRQNAPVDVSVSDAAHTVSASDSGSCN